MPTLLTTKILTVLALPLGVALLLGGVSLGLGLAGRRRLAAGVLALALAILWLASAPASSDALRRRLEATAVAEPRPAAPADAIVVLGGVLGPPVAPRTSADLGQAADRVLHAARLFRQGAAPRVIVSGGAMPWDPEESEEAPSMAALLVEWGVDREAILLETGSRTTYENCRNVAALVREEGLDEVLLVTSALHMRRALATCRTAGLRARPAVTDFEVIERPSAGPLDWLPDAEALHGTQRALKELLGYEVYRWRGWIR